MRDSKKSISIPDERITSQIYYIRGRKVMLDRDLAKLYNIETKGLMQAVRRNIDRFHDDFLFELNYQELINLRSQIVTSSWGSLRISQYKLPYLVTYLYICIV